VTAAELAVVGGAAGVGAVVGALMASAHVSLAGQRWAVPVRPAPSVVVIDRQLTRLLQAGGTTADGGRALHLVGSARPYDWALDGEAVA
jgi:hypothetical protein